VDPPPLSLPSRVDDGSSISCDRRRRCAATWIFPSSTSTRDPARMGRTYGPAAFIACSTGSGPGFPTSSCGRPDRRFPGRRGLPSTACSVLSTSRWTFSGLPLLAEEGLPRSDGVAGTGADEGRARAPGARRPGRPPCRVQRVADRADPRCAREKTAPAERPWPPPGTGAGGRRLRDPLRIRREPGSIVRARVTGAREWDLRGSSCAPRVPNPVDSGRLRVY